MFFEIREQYMKILNCWLHFDVTIEPPINDTTII